MPLCDTEKNYVALLQTSHHRAFEEAASPPQSQGAKYREKKWVIKKVFFLLPDILNFEQ